MAEKMKEAQIPTETKAEGFRRGLGVYEFRSGGKLIAKLEMGRGEVAMTWFMDLTYVAADGEKMVAKDAAERAVVNTNTWKTREIGTPHCTYSAYLEDKKMLQLDGSIKREEDGKEFFYSFLINLEDISKSARKNLTKLLKNPHPKEDWELINSLKQEGPGIFRLMDGKRVAMEVRMSQEGIAMLESGTPMKFQGDKGHVLTAEVDVLFFFDPDLHLKGIQMPGSSPLMLQDGTTSVDVTVEITRDGEKFHRIITFDVNDSEKSVRNILAPYFMREEWERIKRMKPLA